MTAKLLPWPEEIGDKGWYSIFFGNDPKVSYNYPLYPFQVWADNPKRAIELGNLFKANHVTRTGVAYEFRVSLIEKHYGREHPAILHSLCYLQGMAYRSKLFDLDELLGDEGPVHTYAHYHHFKGMYGTEAQWERIKVWCERLENMPGIPSVEVAPLMRVLGPKYVYLG
jgi:hypothetical protein